MFNQFLLTNTSGIALALGIGFLSLGTTPANAGKGNPRDTPVHQRAHVLRIDPARLLDVGFNHKTYYEINPDRLDVITPKLARLTKSKKELRLLRSATVHAKNCLLDKRPEGNFWKRLGQNSKIPSKPCYKKLAILNQWLETAFFNSTRGQRAKAQGEGIYRLFFAEFIQDIAFATTRKTSPLKRQLNWDFTSVTHTQPWIRLFRGNAAQSKAVPKKSMGKGKGEDDQDSTARTGRIPVHRLVVAADRTGSRYFNKTQPSTPVTHQQWEELRRRRTRCLRTDSGAPFAPPYHLAPTPADQAIPLDMLSFPVQRHLQTPAMDLWLIKGDGRCFWHALGFAPQDFVERNIEILHGHNQQLKESLLRHIQIDVRDIIARQNQGRRLLGTEGHPQRALRAIFGIESLANQNIDTLMKATFGDSSTKLNNKKIAQYLWARYVGRAYRATQGPAHALRPHEDLLRNHIDPIDNGMVNIEAINHLAAVLGIGIIVYAEAPSEGYNFVAGQFQPVQIQQRGLTAEHYALACRTALNSGDADLQADVLNDIANQIFNIRQNIAEIRNRPEQYQFQNHQATLHLLNTIFPANLHIMTREQVWQWTTDNKNRAAVLRFIQERFEHRSIIFQYKPAAYDQWINDQDTLASRNNWVLVPAHLFNNPQDQSIELHPAREIQVTTANTEAQNWVTILRKGEHYSTLQPQNAVPQYAEQLVLEELECLTGLARGAFNEPLFNEYIQFVGDLFPSVWQNYGDVLAGKYGIKKGDYNPPLEVKQPMHPAAKASQGPSVGEQAQYIQQVLGMDITLVQNILGKTSIKDLVSLGLDEIIAELKVLGVDVNPTPSNPSQPKNTDAARSGFTPGDDEAQIRDLILGQGEKVSDVAKRLGMEERDMLNLEVDVFVRCIFALVH